MLFNSIAFLFFFTIITSLYYISPYKFRWIILLLGSCYFYMAFVPIYILILGFTIVIDYFAGILIESSTGRKKQLYLICSLMANIGILAVFKYYNFVNANIGVLLKYSGHLNPFPYLSILLPIGLSFHTFQAMSYTIEIYRGKQRSEKHFGIYALYVLFYPQLVAGPIERPQNMIHQFYQKHDFNYKGVTKGLRLMLWGLFMKIVIADNLALVVSKVYGDSLHYKGLAIILATIAFSIQIYCDFCGYSSIAIGAAQTIGIDLMTNFRRPYYSRSIAEFWTRWHISLSTWFKDYLYIPLGGNKVHFYRWILNILIVFIISGLWHGANWTFIIWGGLHGTYLIIGKLSSKLRSKFSKSIGLADFRALENILNISCTFTIVSFTWIFFRANNMHQSFYLIKNLFYDWNLNDAREALAALGQDGTSKIILAFFILCMLGVHYYQEQYGSISILLLKQNLFVRWSIYIFLILSICLFGSFDRLNFIYFNF